MRRHALFLVLVLFLAAGLHSRALALDPVPDVKANGKDGPVTLGLNATLDVTVSLDPGDRAGDGADWWLVAETPAGMYHYTLDGTWEPGLAVTRQAPMSALDPLSVLTTSGLGLGSYTFYFGTDMLVNGRLDLDQAYYDEALVNIITPVTFEKTFGGTAIDFGYSVQETSDGGFIITGGTWSFGVVAWDIYLVKTDAYGNELWAKTFGGKGYDSGHAVQETSDGGFIVAGSIWSSDAYEQDVYLLKTDADGNEVWAKTFGGTDCDEGFSVQETSDSGFIVAGFTASFGAGWDDVYLVRTDAEGNELWAKTFGGEKDEWGFDVEETSDGGFIVAGYTESFSAGWYDVYLVKTDANGQEEWTRTFRSGDCIGRAVEETTDGGLIIAGTSSGIANGPAGGVYLLKTDAEGSEAWSTVVGGSEGGQGDDVQETSDGGFIVAGSIWPFCPCHGDVYLAKTDEDGNEVWTKTFGGPDAELGHSVEETSDGGFIIAGQTSSFGAGNSDVYLIKTDALGNVYE